MTHPRTSREALIVDALGEAARLIAQVEALVPALDLSRQALADAHSGLAGQLAAFESQLAALSEKAKVQVVQHIIARTEASARRSADVQARAMADAARVAFGAELGAALQRLQSRVQPSAGPPSPRWEPWLTHVAAAALGAAVTVIVQARPW